MQVRLDMEDVTITLGNNGVLLKIADNDGKHVGNLRIGQATVEWCKGRTRVGNGKKLRLRELLDLLDDH
jgi:hypothetical protein